MEITHHANTALAIESLQHRADLAADAHRDDDWAETARLLDGLEESVRYARHHLVQHLREGGASWQTVGEALGVTRQAAYERYRGATGPRSGPGQALRDLRQMNVKDS